MGYSSLVFFLAACALGNCMGVPPKVPQATYQARAPQAQQQQRRPQAPPNFVPPQAPRVDSRPSTVFTVTTVTVFGPVATETISQTVTATQMINAGTTTDIRLNDHTKITYDVVATTTSRVYVPRQPETSTSVVTATSGAAGGVTTLTEVLTKDKTFTKTNTRFSTTTINSVSTCTIEHFSTAIDVEIVVIPMTTTIFETSTLTTVAVQRTTVTITNADLNYGGQ